MNKNTYEYEKYIADKSNVKEVIEKYGVAIIPNVLNDKECQNFVNGIWDFFQCISKNWEKPINKNNENSWKEINKLFPLHSMMFQYWKIGHSQAVWDVRQNAKVVDIFANIWDCKKEDLGQN